MARDSDNALILSDGSVFVADQGATPPTDVSADWGVAWEDTGWNTDTGFGEAKNSDTTKKYAINGSVIKIVKSSDERTFTFECYESNATVLGLTRPGSAPATVGGVTTTEVKAFVGSNIKAFGLEYVYGDIVRRVVIPSGEATLTDTIQEAYTDLTIYKFSVDCYPDSDGTLYINMTNNPAEAVS